MDSTAESAGTNRLKRLPHLAALMALLLILALAAYSAGGNDDRLNASLPRSISPVRAESARVFVDSIGVNTHLHYTDTAYADYPLVRDRLRDLGVKHIRDAMVGNSRRQQRRLDDLARLGIKANLIVGNPPLRRGSPIPKHQISVRRRSRGGIESIEGPNEYDNTGDPDWAMTLRDYQRRLYRAVSSDPKLDVLPVLGPSLVSPESHVSLADVSAYLDYGNIHSYPGGQPPHLANFGRTLAQALDDARRNSGMKPIVATESGYHNATATTSDHPPASERAAGIYVPRLVVEYFRRGVARTYLYEFVDEKPDAPRTDPEQHFGLLRNDFSPKPAYLALKNLLALLRDQPGKGITGSLRYRLEGQVEGVNQLLLGKRDGSFYLLLWQSASVFDVERRKDVDPPARAITVRFGEPLAVAESYRPGQSSSPLARYAKVKTIKVSVPSDMIVMRLDSRP